MFGEMSKYFEVYPGTPSYKETRSTVHNGNMYRTDKAKKQVEKPPVAIDTIISYVNDFLSAMKMLPVEAPIVYNPQEIDYNKIKKEYKLSDENDIVWMKFTKDGYLGVVGASADAYDFNMPTRAAEYDEKKDELSNEFKYRSAAILVHQVKKEWDTSFVLIFPLVNIPAGLKRNKIERAIGNYLIEKGVPIIDFYSHNGFYERKETEKDENDMEMIGDTFFDLYPNATEYELDEEMECWDGIDI